MHPPLWNGRILHYICAIHTLKFGGSSAKPRFLRVKKWITARCSSLDIWFVHVHKTPNGRYFPLKHKSNPEFGWHYVGDRGCYLVLFRVLPFMNSRCWKPFYEFSDPPINMYNRKFPALTIWERFWQGPTFAHTFERSTNSWCHHRSAHNQTAAVVAWAGGARDQYWALIIRHVLDSTNVAECLTQPLDLGQEGNTSHKWGKTKTDAHSGFRSGIHSQEATSRLLTEKWRSPD
jgi:hypothetical protein